MRKLILLSIILIILSFFGYKAYQKSLIDNKMGAISADSQFGVADKESIHKIVVKRQNDQIVFQKKDNNNWMLNDTYLADEGVFSNMINVIHKMRMKSIPSKNATENIKESIKNGGIKVEVFDKNDKNLRTFYIATDMQSGDGTYMLLEGSNQPYAMELPALDGGLRSRFEQPLRNYRDKTIYRESAGSIKSISVNYPKDIKSSFQINLINENYELSPLDPLTEKMEKLYNPNKIKTYLDYFEQMGAEGFANDYVAKDSVRALIPFCTIHIEKKDGKVLKYSYWSYDDVFAKREAIRRAVDAQNTERFFVNTEDGDFYTVQGRVFGKIFAAYPYFF